MVLDIDGVDGQLIPILNTYFHVFLLHTYWLVSTLPVK